MSRTPIEWLYDLQHFGIKLGLENIRAVLDRLGHPEAAFSSIHVAGTNGKGSVAAMLDSMLRACGLRAALFTSPHLVRPNERIRIDGADITDEDLDRALIELRDEIGAGLADGSLTAHPSFFEAITATALQEFRRRRVDVAVLEVGLGGRLDATNAVDADLAVIVTIDLDHTKSLGPTLERIAAEKGGIIKPGRPVVTGVTAPGPLAVLRRICDRRGARRIDAVREGAIHVRSDGAFDLETRRTRYEGLRLPLRGSFQRDNARVAVVALETFADVRGVVLPKEAIARGLASTRWRGRLEWLPGRPRVLLDAAHNREGVAALAGYLDGLERPAPVLLFASTREKDLETVLAPLIPRVRGVVATRSRVNRAMEPDRIGSFARSRIDPVRVVENPAEAFGVASDLAGPDGVVLVAGSLYLVGDVLGLLERRPTPGPVAM